MNTSLGAKNAIDNGSGFPAGNLLESQINSKQHKIKMIVLIQNPTFAGDIASMCSNVRDNLQVCRDTPFIFFSGFSRSKNPRDRWETLSVQLDQELLPEANVEDFARIVPNQSSF